MPIVDAALVEIEISMCYHSGRPVVQNFFEMKMAEKSCKPSQPDGKNTMISQVFKSECWNDKTMCGIASSCMQTRPLPISVIPIGIDGRILCGLQR